MILRELFHLSKLMAFQNNEEVLKARKRRQWKRTPKTALRKQLWLQQEGKCAYCHAPIGSTKSTRYGVDKVPSFHHVIAISTPEGTNDIDNLQLLHMACHVELHRLEKKDKNDEQETKDSTGDSSVSSI